MESADALRGRDVLRRSPLDVIMNQIRRKRTPSDRKSLGRFLSRPAGGAGVPEDGEQSGPSSGVPGVAEAADDGWGRLCVFLQRLGKKADCRSLNLSHCDLTATDLLELATLLRFLPHLEEVDVSWNELIGGGLQALTSHLQAAVAMTTLRLCSCRLGAADVAVLGEALGCLSLLEILDLSWNSGVGGGALQSLLGNLPPPLRELHLVSCQLTADDAAILGGVVSALPGLSLLDVSCNPRLAQEAGGGGFGALTSSLSRAASLAVLRFQACGVTSAGLDAIGGSLRCLPCVQELDLSCNKSLAGGLHRLTPHLALLSHLHSLDLHLCCLTHCDLLALIQVLPCLAALTDLDLSSNQAAGGVAHLLVPALAVTQVRRLPFNSCSLNEEALTALAVVAPYLLSVDVSWCKSVGGRLSLLVEALQPSIILQLRLSSCDLTTEDLHHLAAACRRGCLSSLRVLDLSFNGAVGDGGWAALFSAGGLGSLEEVDLSLRPLTSAACAAWLPALLAALPRLPALARLAARRWRIGAAHRQQLSFILRKRSVLLEWDPPDEEVTSSPQAANQESLEESPPEEKEVEN